MGDKPFPLGKTDGGGGDKPFPLGRIPKANAILPFPWRQIEPTLLKQKEQKVTAALDDDPNEQLSGLADITYIAFLLGREILVAAIGAFPTTGYSSHLAELVGPLPDYGSEDGASCIAFLVTLPNPETPVLQVRVPFVAAGIFHEPQNRKYVSIVDGLGVHWVPLTEVFRDGGQGIE